MKKIFFLLGLFVFQLALGQSFNEYFEDATYRLDYIFGGNINQQKAYLQEVTHIEKWHGRVDNLDSTPIQGQAQIRVYDQDTNKLIYVLPFGSLFQEWLTQEQAHKQTRAFENSFLIPKPHKDIKVEIVFFDSKRKEHLISSEVIEVRDILIRKSNPSDVHPFEVLHKADIEYPIKIAIVAEGYTADEMDNFWAKAKQTVQHLFEHKAFGTHKDRIQIVAVPFISEDAQVSIPSAGIWKKTAVSSNFDTFYSQRYLTTSRVFQLHRILENIPYHHIVILANTTTYGGGGILNAYTLTTTEHAMFAPVVVHEIGHSIGGLADEYFYPNDVFEATSVQDVEPWEQNITNLVDFDSKWKTMLGKKVPIPTPKEKSEKYKIGVYEGLEGNGIYIPSYDCRMKHNKAKDFCPVCTKALSDMIDYYTLPKNK
ncbi:MAG: M64 family metallopeptidase [Bacteroidota bacterium]|nr:M64 family metallopeptidase [Bacteroidota bacterium]